jgi:putative ABC transport system permease protein
MNGVGRDFRTALRWLGNNRGFTLVAVSTMALGIGANTAMFSIVNGVMLRPLPYAAADELVILWTVDRRRGILEEGTSYPTFADWRVQNHTFADMAFSSRGKTVTLGGGAEPELVLGDAVSGNLFDVLAVRPILGRAFGKDDDQEATPHGEPVILSFGFWQRHFGGASDVLGRSISIDGQPAVVIGVMPRDFFYPGRETQLWWLSRGGRGDRFADSFRVVGRLRPGVSVRQAQADMDVIGQRLSQTYLSPNDAFAGFGVNVVPLLDQIVGTNLQRSLWVLLGAVTMVLLIACANVANLVLARGAARESELAIRAALGAGPLRIARQLLVESGTLAFLSAVIGLALAAASLKVLRLWAPPGFPRLDEIVVDLRVLAFTSIVTIAATLLFGLMPAMRASPDSASRIMQMTGRVHGNRGLGRTRALLVVSECASAVVLLIGAGLLIRSFIRLHAVDPGFEPDGALVARVVAPPAAQAPAEVALYFSQVLERVATLPGVRAAGLITDMFPSTNPDQAILIEGREPLEDPPGQLSSESVTHDVFRALGVQMVAGRMLTAQDEARDVALINLTLARRFFGEDNPIGRRIRFPPDDRWHTIIGVVADMRRRGLEREPIAEVYKPSIWLSIMDLIVRVDGDAQAMAPGVRQAIRSIHEGAVVSSVAPLARELNSLTAVRAFHTGILGLFSAVALVLAVIGIYGVLHYNVVQRTREIGVRMALGARPRDASNLVVTQGMSIVLLGIVLGVVTAVMLTGVLSHVLYGIAATDPVTYLVVAATLCGSALVACVLPAWRASRVHPLEALRSE